MYCKSYCPHARAHTHDTRDQSKVVGKNAYEYEVMTAWLCIAGARRFVVLDFGKPVLLTDVIVPMCGDLASLSIDVWVDSEETDGHRLVVSSDIGVCSLIMNDIMPPPVCRFLKVNER